MPWWVWPMSLRKMSQYQGSSRPMSVRARSNWATIHSSMNSLKDCLRCSSGV
jgi:hypothetical protein